MASDPRTFGERLRAAMVRGHHLDIPEFASACKCKPYQIRRLLDGGHPSLTQFVRICDALDISADELLGRVRR